MKKQTLSEFFKDYDKNKSLGKKLIGDSGNLKKIRKLLEEYLFLQYDVLHLLIPQKKDDPALNILRKHFGDLYESFLLLYQTNPKLCNAHNTHLLTEVFGEASKIYNKDIDYYPSEKFFNFKFIWNALPAVHRTEQTLKLLLQNSEYRHRFNVIDKLLKQHLVQSPEELNAICLLAVLFPRRDFTPAELNQGLEILINKDANEQKSLIQLWNKLPDNLKTLQNLNQFTAKAENINAVLFMISIFPHETDADTQDLINTALEEAVPLNIAYQKVITDINFGQQNTDRASYSSKLINLTNRLKLVLPEDSRNLLIPVAINLGEENPETRFIEQLEAVDYIFRLIPFRFYSPANFNQIAENYISINQYASVQGEAVLRQLAGQIPEHLFTQNIFNQIMTLTTAPENERATALVNLRASVAALLGMEHQNLDRQDAVNFHRRAAANFNTTQSTHTASVHASVSESAIKLFKRYGKQINTEKQMLDIIKDISTWFDSTTAANLGVKELEFNSAMRVINFITNPTYSYIDPASHISTYQLFLLIWLGIQDDSMRLSTKEDALKKMVIALYDIQRGYNLDENFQERNPLEADIKICSGGTFNKLMEILWGIHQDVELKFITKAGAAKKIQGLTRELVKEHLSQLKNQVKTSEDKTNYLGLVKSLLEEGVEPVWQEIQPKLTELMLDEFDSIYHGKNDKDFVELIEAAKWTDLSKLHLEKYIANPAVNINDIASPDADANSDTESNERESANERLEQKPTASTPQGFFHNPIITSSLETSSANTFSQNWFELLNRIIDSTMIALHGQNEPFYKELKGFKHFINHLPLNNNESFNKLERNLGRTIHQLTALHDKLATTLESLKDEKSAAPITPIVAYDKCLKELLRLQKNLPQLREENTARVNRSI